MADAYDIIIIGAGIAGLYTAINCLKKKKGSRIALIDSYHVAGGRMATFSADISGVHYQWEKGAARISTNHRIIMGLFKKYGLPTIPIQGNSQFKESGLFPLEPDEFPAALPVTIGTLSKLSPEILATKTIRQILSQLYPPKELEAIVVRFPYRAEIDTMRADMAIPLFLNEFGESEKYVLCKPGLSALIQKMVDEFEKLGGFLFLKHKVKRIQGNHEVVFVKDKNPEHLVMRGEKLVFAMDRDGLAQLPEFADWPLLKHLMMKPLLRVYGAFPKNPDGKFWFEGLPKVITAQRPRFIIPGNLETGVIQISYTDSIDAEPLMKIMEEEKTTLEEVLIKDLRLLFGKDRHIPAPLFVKACKWKSGVTYWLPGSYDPYKESKAAIRPFPKLRPNWFVCGESFSTRQGWIEGALEHAELALKEI